MIDFTVNENSFSFLLSGAAGNNNNVKVQLRLRVKEESRKVITEITIIAIYENENDGDFLIIGNLGSTYQVD
jgi:hypothetical protein